MHLNVDFLPIVNVMSTASLKSATIKVTVHNKMFFVGSVATEFMGEIVVK